MAEQREPLRADMRALLQRCADKICEYAGSDTDALHIVNVLDRILGSTRILPPSAAPSQQQQKDSGEISVLHPEPGIPSNPAVEMVERVARAIYGAVWEARPTQNPCPYEERDEPEVELTMARAAIAAMRDPTEAMLNGARDWSVKKYGIGVGNDGATGCWGAMIDAALSPPNVE